MEPSPERQQYRPSGRVDLLRFGLWYVFLALPLALLCGYLLCLVFNAGFYLVVLAPLLAGGLASAGVAAAVHLGRCRNRWFAALAGLLVGAVTFLSYYQFHFASLFGFQHVHRIDLLPRWVHFRVLTDEQKRIGDVALRGNVPVGPKQPDPIDLFFRWLFFTLSGLVVVLPSVGVGWTLASRPFEEQHRRWMATHSQRLMPPMTDAIFNGLASAGREDLADVLRPALNVPPEMAAELRFQYLPDVPDTPVYLSVVQLVFTGKNNPPTQKVLLNRVLLDPEEAQALAAAVHLPRTGEAARALPPVAALTDHLSGMVTPLPPEEAGKIMTRGHSYRAVAIQLAPLLAALLVAAGLIYLVYVNWAEWELVLRVLGIALAGAAPLGALVYLMRYEHYLPGLYQHRRVMQVLRSRPESFVDPDDPEALFVEVIPRAHWGKMMARNASDVGMLKVDRQRRAILFEGDRERWAIPAESVLSCQVEQFTELGMEQNQYNLHSVVVLVANVGGRPWEAPLCRRTTAFRPWNAALRKQLADELQAAIAEVLPAKEG